MPSMAILKGHTMTDYTKSFKMLQEAETNLFYAYCQTNDENIKQLWQATKSGLKKFYDEHKDQIKAGE